MNIPKHIVLFPDGNRRWALQNNLSVTEGYLVGKNKFNDFFGWCKKRGVKFITVFGFSSENWKRPQEQVNFLMNIFEKYLEEGIDDFNKEGVKVVIIGQKHKLSEKLQQVVEKVEKSTENNHQMQINLAVSYGGKWDIIQAIQRIIKDGVDPSKINEETFDNYLSTAGLPDPDLVIRAGGEMRLSNFLLWQAAYSELYFSDKLWPDFTENDLDLAILEFNKRARRFGG